jgi:tRNA pseudouridine38-40 synthase
MQQAAALVIGEHDFSSFAAADPDLEHRSHPETESGNIRVIRDSAWHLEQDLLTYRAQGNGFLHHMVRNLVGTFLEVGRGALAPDAISTILIARDRQLAGPTAPACGLFLTRVEYDAAHPAHL